MKCLVCISKTPDTSSKISFDAAGKNLLEEGLSFIMNPYDEWYALVRAIELKEQLGGQVDVIHVGAASSEMIIRKALAIGADAAYRVDLSNSDAFQIASNISNFAKNKDYDLILLGKETIDYNGSEVGSILAGLLDLNFISYCTKLETDGTVANLTREIDGGSEIVELKFPFVLSAAKGLAEQRIPNMKGIMDAKKKPLETIMADGSNAKINLVQFELPAAKTSVTMISPDNLDELIQILHTEAKVI